MIRMRGKRLGTAGFSKTNKLFSVLYKWIIRGCLLYTSDAADERSSVDLGGRRIIKKKSHDDLQWRIRININEVNT